MKVISPINWNLTKECDSMKCPYCNNEMEKGELKSRGGVFFLPDGEKMPKLYTENQMKKHNAVYLPPYMTAVLPEYPTAYICRLCCKIVIEY